MQEMLLSGAAEVNCFFVQERFVGSLLGVALADALGAPYEGGVFERITWSTVTAFRSRLAWTDDTEMTLGLAESLIENRGLDSDNLARHWARCMNASRGYGPGTRALLERIRKGADWRSVNRSAYPEGSMGNGAAMRAAPLGLLYHRDPEQLRRNTERASVITHAHPLAVEGAQLIARAVALALRSEVRIEDLRPVCALEEYRRRLDLAERFLRGEPSLQEVREGLGHHAEAHRSAVTAIYAFLRFPRDFAAMMEYIVSLGGDVDTLGAMAGGIFGACNGVRALPEDLLERLEERDRIEALARGLYGLL